MVRRPGSGLLRRRRVRNPLLLTFVAAIVASSAVGAIGMVQMSRIAADTQTLYTQSLLPLHTIDSLNALLWHQRWASLSHLTADDPVKSKGYAAETTELRAELNQRIAYFDTLTVPARLRTAMEAFKASWAHYLQMSKESAAIKKAGKLVEWQAFRTRYVNPATQKASADLVTAKTLAIQLADDAAVAAREAAGRARLLTGVILGASVVLAAGFALYVARSLARRIQGDRAELLRGSLAELTTIHEPDQLMRQLFLTLFAQVDAVTGCLVGPDGTTVVAVAGQTPDDMVGGTLELALAEISSPVLRPTPAGAAEAFGKAPVVLVVPLTHRDARAGVALFGCARADEGARQVAEALAAQGMGAYDNACLFSRVQELATTDELTGQHNRRHFYELAGALTQVAVRNGRDLAAAMLDIDKFKNINDTYGHGVGDEVIRTVAARLRAAVRHSDVLGRYGGEEFALVLPDHGGNALELTERMRAAVAAEPIATAAGPVAVTISVGVTFLATSDESLDDLLARADHALYRAKEGGRNQVVRS